MLQTQLSHNYFNLSYKFYEVVEYSEMEFNVGFQREHREPNKLVKLSLSAIKKYTPK